jgi:hypothetical protein
VWPPGRMARVAMEGRGIVPDAAGARDDASQQEEVTVQIDRVSVACRSHRFFLHGDLTNVVS